MRLLAPNRVFQKTYRGEMFLRFTKQIFEVVSK